MPPSSQTHPARDRGDAASADPGPPSALPTPPNPGTTIYHFPTSSRPPESSRAESTLGKGESTQIAPSDSASLQVVLPTSSNIPSRSSSSQATPTTSSPAVLSTDAGHRRANRTLIGGIVGVALSLALLLFSAWYLRRRARMRHHRTQQSTSPDTVPTTRLETNSRGETIMLLDADPLPATSSTTATNIAASVVETQRLAIDKVGRRPRPSTRNVPIDRDGEIPMSQAEITLATLEQLRSMTLRLAEVEARVSNPNAEPPPEYSAGLGTGGS
ncbi:hypothetical protein MKEN_01311500 [Mycena kentingensis (nom. inval.)]|nr:hypothetical protein MKEN_01311500 [Mycena kentingensis (nom. inval.)]